MDHLRLKLWLLPLVLAALFAAPSRVTAQWTLPDVVVAPGAKFADDKRIWQGIPGIERTPDGRLWATWYSGGEGEGKPGNFVLLANSSDEGATWSKPLLAIVPLDAERTFDPCLWLDPSNRLWLFFGQSKFVRGGPGVLAIRCEDTSKESLEWSVPALVFEGVMLNKPLVHSSGAWLLPVSMWNWRKSDNFEIASGRHAGVVTTKDDGQTWTFVGGATVPASDKNFDEHMLIERHDDSLWMLLRIRNGIGQSESRDVGRTWSAVTNSGIAGPTSRFFVRRLASDNLLLLNHRNFKGRSHLTASLSDDDGKTWKSHLLLDERKGVSYPDAIQGPTGTIYAIYDHGRYSARERDPAGEIHRSRYRGRPDYFVRFKTANAREQGHWRADPIAWGPMTVSARRGMLTPGETRRRQRQILWTHRPAPVCSAREFDAGSPAVA